VLVSEERTRIMNDLHELLDRTARWVADTSGFDRLRVRRILEKRLEDSTARSSAEQARVSLDVAGSILPGQLLEASKHVGPQRALELFERTDLDRLFARHVYVRRWSRDDPLLYTAPELASRLAALEDHLTCNRQHLLATGYPVVMTPEAHSLTSSLWWYQFGMLYPTKIPAGQSATRDASKVYHNVFVWSRKPTASFLTREGLLAKRAAGASATCRPDEICDYESAPPMDGMTPEDATHLEKLRGKVLEFEIRILGALREAATAGRASDVWEGCLSLLTGSVVAREQRLSGHDIDFLQGVDRFYAGPDVLPSSLPGTRVASLPGTFSHVILLICLCEWVLTSRVTQRIREALDPAGLIDGQALCPARLSIRSPYEIVGTPAEGALDRAIGLHLASIKEAGDFVQEFFQRVKMLLEHDIPVPLAVEMWVRRGAEKDARAILEVFSKAQAAHIEHFGKPLPLSLCSSDHRDEEAARAQEDTFHREYTGVWEIVFRGRRITLRDLKGLWYMRELLRHPNKPISAVALSAAVHRDRQPDDSETSRRMTAEQHGEVGFRQRDANRAEVIADARAIEDIKSEIAQIDEKIEAAERVSNFEQAQALDQEKAKLEEYLKSALGLGGKARGSGGGQKRAADAVGSAISDARKKIRNAHPELGEHLDACIKPGRFCSYEPHEKIRWLF
jgi:hypothetical protein